jgi:hypothetical protein
MMMMMMMMMLMMIIIIIIQLFILCAASTAKRPITDTAQIYYIKCKLKIQYKICNHYYNKYYY